MYAYPVGLFTGWVYAKEALAIALDVFLLCPCKGLQAFVRGSRVTSRGEHNKHHLHGHHIRAWPSGQGDDSYLLDRISLVI